MMQSVSPELTAACTARGQRPIVYVEFSWNTAGSILAARGGAGWVNETSYLKADGAELRINPPGERLVQAGEIGAGKLLMDNTTARYSWRRTDSALYAFIGYANRPAGPVGTPVRIWRGYVTSNGPEYVCVFTGVVSGWNERPDATVAFTLADWGYKYMQSRFSRAVSEAQLPSTWINTVATAGGIVAGAMALDIGVLPIPFTWMDDEFMVGEIWLTAESDGGQALFDQRGILQYWNPLHWIAKPSVWTFDEDSYTLPEPETNPDNVATEVTVEFSSRSASIETDLYILDRVHVVMPEQTDTWVARFDYAALEVYDPDPADPNNDYYATSAGGVPMNGDITVTISQTFGQQCTISITNNSTTQAARVSWLRLRGVPLIGGPADEVKVTVSPAPLPFPRQRSIRSSSTAQGPLMARVQGNIYLQTLDQAQALAGMTAIRCRRVRTIWTLQNVWGIPQLELGDRVTFRDTRSLGTGEEVEGLVIGISWGRDTKGGFLQTLSLMDVSDLSEFSNYFLIGVSKLGGPLTEEAEDPSGEYGRAWY